MSPTMSAIARARAARARATASPEFVHISAPTGFTHIAGVDTRSPSDNIYAALHKASDRLIPPEDGASLPAVAAAAAASPPASADALLADADAAAAAAAAKSRRRKSHAIDAADVQAAVDGKTRRRRHHKKAGTSDDDSSTAATSTVAAAAVASPVSSPPAKPPVPKSKPPVPTSKPPDRLTSRPVLDATPPPAAVADPAALAAAAPPAQEPPAAAPVADATPAAEAVVAAEAAAESSSESEIDATPSLKSDSVTETRPRRSSTDAGDDGLSESIDQDRAAELLLRSRDNNSARMESTAPTQASSSTPPPAAADASAADTSLAAAVTVDGGDSGAHESESSSTSGSPLARSHKIPLRPNLPSSKPQRPATRLIGEASDDGAWKESEGSAKSEATTRTSGGGASSSPPVTPKPENPYGNVRAAIEAAEATAAAAASAAAPPPQQQQQQLPPQPMAIVGLLSAHRVEANAASRVPRASILLSELDELAALEAAEPPKAADAVRCAFPGCISTFASMSLLASHVSTEHAPARQAQQARMSPPRVTASPARTDVDAVAAADAVAPASPNLAARTANPKPKNSPGLIARFTRSKKTEEIQISDPTFSQEGTDRVKEEFRAKLEPLRQSVAKPAPAATPVVAAEPQSGLRTLKRDTLSSAGLSKLHEQAMEAAQQQQQQQQQQHQALSASTEAAASAAAAAPAPQTAAPAEPEPVVAAAAAPAVAAVPVGAKPPPPPGKPPTAQPEQIVCSAPGCDMHFETQQALSQHRVSAHGKVDISASDLLMRRASGSSPAIVRRNSGGPGAAPPGRAPQQQAVGRVMQGAARRGSPQGSPVLPLRAAAQASPDTRPSVPQGSPTQFKTLPRSFRPDGSFRPPAVRSPPPVLSHVGAQPPPPPAPITMPVKVSAQPSEAPAPAPASTATTATSSSSVASSPIKMPSSRLSMKTLPIAQLHESSESRPALAAGDFHQYYMYPAQYHMHYRRPETDLVAPMPNDLRAKLAPEAEYKPIVMKRAAMQLIQGHPWTERLRPTIRAKRDGAQEPAAAAASMAASGASVEDSQDSGTAGQSILDEFVSVDLAQVRQWPHLRGEVRARNDPVRTPGRAFQLLNDLVQDSDDDSLTPTSATSESPMTTRGSRRVGSLLYSDHGDNVSHLSDLTDETDDGDAAIDEETIGSSDSEADATPVPDDSEEHDAKRAEQTSGRQGNDAAVTAAAAAAVAQAPKETTSERAAMTLQETLNMLAQLSKNKKPVPEPPAAAAAAAAATTTTLTASAAVVASAPSSASSSWTAAQPASPAPQSPMLGRTQSMRQSGDLALRRESDLALRRESDLALRRESSHDSMNSSTATHDSGAFEIMLNSDRQAAMEAAQTKMRGLSEREKVVTELIDTERTYLEHLGMLINGYEKPMLATELVTQYAHKRIFTNVVALHQVVLELVQAINASEAQGAHFSSIGRTYDEKVTVQFGKLYAVNITQSERAAETLGQLLKSSKLLREFLAESRKLGRRALEDLLLAPFQRACRLPLLFKELLKHTADDDPDRAACEAVLSKLNSINTEINDFKRDQDELVKTRLIEDAVVGPNKLLPSSTRRLVRQAMCACVRHNGKDLGEMHVLLFTDVLYACKRASSRDRDLYKLKVVVRLVQTAKVREARVKRFPFAFEILLSDGAVEASTMLAFDTLEQKIVWMCEVEGATLQV